jgi:predicted GNAT superfamily acetyltransferase
MYGRQPPATVDLKIKMTSKAASPGFPSAVADQARPVTIRRVTTQAEYEECIRIQRDTWGRQFTETVPATILRVSQEVGGITAAAFDADGEMLGFVFGMTGIRNGELAHWSDMLAVRADVRNLGLGKRLKQYQRELLLEIGVHTMYWTYDPLVARNAYLNLEQLGARPVEYRLNYYGDDTGSVMHTALGTDRFIVAWKLDEPARPPRTHDDWLDVPIIASDRNAVLPEAARVRIAIPNDIFAVVDSDSHAATAWREVTRAALVTYLDRGYVVAGFMRSNELSPPTYLLQR